MPPIVIRPRPVPTKALKLAQAALAKSESDESGAGPSPGQRKIMVVYAFEEGSAGNMLVESILERMDGDDAPERAEWHMCDLTIAPCHGCYAGGGRVCLMPCDRNDIDSDIYDPKDDMIKLYDSLQSCDGLILAGDTRMGLPGPHVTEFLQRLLPFSNLISQGTNLLKDKVAAVAMVGGPAQAGPVVAALSSVGFELTTPASVWFELHPHASPSGAKKAFLQASGLHQQIDTLASSMIEKIKKGKGES